MVVCGWAGRWVGGWVGTKVGERMGLGTPEALQHGAIVGMDWIGLGWV